ncbi:hypothetical protein SAMN02745136_00421 [Anaerocolumna jejuensis DSM 15929]|uniref:Uncharacterized protein n=1 Tax=Anaerocolumna jejuensis DSM 15929 TaxID=1121322 RepID=A0A1M6KE63_9FIRM|nr:hypothetical protein [Anaerocolumna jejuensis]SHJ57254.1 hypothetical protein SAMN02745136_00421 [Anaerocolumna jejuensis DSM 15929]
MGTRGLVCVQKDGEYKVAQYGQYDTNPYGSGVCILKFLKNVNLRVLESDISECVFYTKEQLQEILSEYKPGTMIFGVPWHRELCGITFEEILSLIMFGNLRSLKNNSEFAQDSLFCEWGYVIDFDKRTFEVYKGFNKRNLTKKDRFYKGKSTEEYKPIKLARSYSLNALPTEEEFLDFFYPDEDGEEVS